MQLTIALSRVALLTSITLIAFTFFMTSGRQKYATGWNPRPASRSHTGCKYSVTSRGGLSVAGSNSTTCVGHLSLNMLKISSGTRTYGIAKTTMMTTKMESWCDTIDLNVARKC